MQKQREPTKLTKFILSTIKEDVEGESTSESQINLNLPATSPTSSPPTASSAIVPAPSQECLLSPTDATATSMESRSDEKSAAPANGSEPEAEFLPELISTPTGAIPLRPERRKRRNKPNISGMSIDPERKQPTNDKDSLKDGTDTTGISNLGDEDIVDESLQEVSISYASDEESSTGSTPVTPSKPPRRKNKSTESVPEYFGISSKLHTGRRKISSSIFGKKSRSISLPDVFEEYNESKQVKKKLSQSFEKVIMKIMDLTEIFKKIHYCMGQLEFMHKYIIGIAEPDHAGLSFSFEGLKKRSLEINTSLSLLMETIEDSKEPISQTRVYLTKINGDINIFLVLLGAMLREYKTLESSYQETDIVKCYKRDKVFVLRKMDCLNENLRSMRRKLMEHFTSYEVSVREYMAKRQLPVDPTPREGIAERFLRALPSFNRGDTHG